MKLPISKNIHMSISNEVFLTLMLVFSVLFIPSCSIANNVFDEYRSTYNYKNRVVYVSGKQLRRHISGDKFQNMLIKVDFKNQSITVLEGPWKRKKGITHKAALSGNRKYLSFLYSEFTVTTSLYLISLPGEGAALKIDENVSVYDWSPDSRYVVYIKRDNEGVYLYSIEDGSKIKITDTAREISWAKYDNTVYLIKGDYEHDQFFRYDKRNNHLVKENTKGINFSSDGKYYCQAVVESESMTYPAVYESSTNVVIKGFYEEANASNGLSECHWINNYVLASQSLTSFFLYDVSKGKIIRNNLDSRRKGKYVRNSFAPVAYGGNKMVVYRNGYWELQNIFTGKVLKKVKNTAFENRKL